MWGGGSSSGTLTSATEGVGTYLDYRVGGIPYYVGETRRYTTDQGQFRFTRGQPVEFRLGKKVLRTIGAEDTNASEITVVETNASVAAALQTLDADGNASNGITILPELVDLFDDNTSGIALDANLSIPDANLTSIKNKITAFTSLKTTMVTKTDALVHVLETISKELTNDENTKAKALENITTSMIDEKLDANSTAFEELLKIVNDNNETNSTIMKNLLSTVTEKLIDANKTTAEGFDDLNTTVDNIKKEENKAFIKFDKFTTFIDDAIKLSDDNATTGLDSLLSNIKTDAAAHTSPDAALLVALIEIAEVTTTPAVQSLVNYNNGGTFNLDIFLESTSDKLETANNISFAGGVEVLHTYATKLKNSADKIDGSFSSKLREFTYGTGTNEVTINYDQAMAIKASALMSASILEFLASYTYGDDNHYVPQTYTINQKFDGWAIFDDTFKNIDANSSGYFIDKYNNLPASTEVEYYNGSYDHLELLNDTSFFKMKDTARLATAHEYLKTAALTASTINEKRLKENNTSSSITANDIQIATRLKTALYNNTAFVEDKNEIFVNKIFSATTYLDRNDYASNFEYQDGNGTKKELAVDMSKATDEALYLFKTYTEADNLMNSNNWHHDTNVMEFSYSTSSKFSYPTKAYKSLTAVATTPVNASQTDFDDILVKVRDGNTSVTFEEYMKDEPLFTK